MAERRRGRDEEQDRGTKAEHGIAREDEGMDDRGTKAEHGIAREDEGMEDRGTKAEHGIGPEDEGVERPIWKEPRPTEREEEKDVDPKAELGGGNNTDWLKDPKSELGVTSAGNDEALERPTDDFAGVLPPFADDPTVDAAAIDVGPIGREGGDEGDPAGFDIGPVGRERGDEGDPAAVIWPDYQEGPESIDAEAEDADWADEDAETEVDIDVENDEDVDTFEEVDIDDEGEDE